MITNVGRVKSSAVLMLLLAATAGCVRLAAKKWSEYLVVVVLAGMLARPILVFVTGDISRWLPSWLWSDGSDGKDQIVFVSAIATLLLPFICSGVLVFLGKLVWRNVARSRRPRMD